MIETLTRPVMWINLVHVQGAAEPRIRAWTTDPARAEQLKREGLDMQPLVLATADQVKQQTDLMALWAMLGVDDQEQAARVITEFRKVTIEACMEQISNQRISEAGLFDPKHSGQRGADRADALFDAYQLLKKFITAPGADRG